jgi:hypothetical protein
MMNPDLEIRRLLDLMPASGRMKAKIVSKPQQSTVIECPFPQPWVQEWPIVINFDLWSRLSKPERDLLILRTVSWLSTRNWLKPELYQGLVLAGVLGAIVELFQADAVGVVVSSGLSAIAATQIWRTSRSPQVEMEADEAAIKVAQRRGYPEAEAARHLLSAIQAIAKIEGRPNLEFDQLIRCQNLRAIAGISTIGVPKPLK